MSLISTKTGEPIETVSPDDLGGFALGLAKQILGPLGAQWFYEGSSLGYRTLYVWIAVGSDDHCPDQLAAAGRHRQDRRRRQRAL